MTMNEIGTYTPENFLAGDYPVAKTFVVANEAVAKFEPVSLADGELVPVTDPEDAGIYGIAVHGADAGEQVAIYLTGEFFGSALHLQDGVTLDAITPAFRKLGIFLK
jgi:hypothetical protein